MTTEIPEAGSQSRSRLAAILRKPVRWLWGYDFFISYHWNSGGAYAVSLAQELRDRNYAVFLDRYEYAAGEDLKAAGEVAISNTKRLILLATPEAVFESEWVRHEVDLFASRRSSQIIPIFFGENFEGVAERDSDVLRKVAESVLSVVEVPEQLQLGRPSDQTVQKLANSIAIFRRRTNRAIFFTLMTILVLVAANIALRQYLAAVLSIEARDFSVARGVFVPGDNSQADSVVFRNIPSVNALSYVNRITSGAELQCRIDVAPARLGRRDIERILTLENLTTLAFEKGQLLRPDALEPLSKCSTLKHLKIRELNGPQQQHNHAYMKAISRCISLESLSYILSGLKTDDLMPLENSSLRCLVLTANSDLNAAAMEKLLQMHALRMLCIDGNPRMLEIAPLRLAELLEVSQLESLSAVFCSVPAEIQQVIAGSSSLRNLVIRHNPLECDALLRMLSNPGIQLLDVGQSDCSREQLADVLRERNSPLTLRIGAGGVSALSDLVMPAGIAIEESVGGFSEGLCD